MIKLREFTDDDWQAWCGTDAPEGGKPLIAEIFVTLPDGRRLGTTVICDANGLFLEIWDDFGNNQLVWQLDASFKAARTFAGSVLNDEMEYAALDSLGLMTFGTLDDLIVK